MKKNWLRICAALMISLFACTNPMNPWYGGGNSPDMGDPTVEILSHRNNDLVRGTIVLSGMAKDDLTVKSVELYLVTSGENGAKDLLVGKSGVKEESWSISFDTTAYEDGATLLKVKAIDSASKFAYSNVNLMFDNYGPLIVINQPEETSGPSNPIYNLFQVAILPVDLEENQMTEVQWRIESEDASVWIEGKLDLKDAPAPANANYKFDIDPSPLINIPGFNAGFFNLLIRASDQEGKVSREWRSRRIYINFGNAIPRIFITTPDTKDKNNPKLTGSDITLTGQVTDDDGVVEVTIEWGVAGSGNMRTETFDYRSESEPVLNKAFTLKLSGLEDGVYQVRGKAKDVKYNQSKWTDFYYFKADSNFPKIDFTSPEQGAWLKGNVTIEATVSIGGLSKITKVEYQIGKNGVWKNYSSPQINSQSVPFQYTLRPSEMPSGGEVSFSVRGYRADNYSEATVLFNVDHQAPVVTIDYPAASDRDLNQKIMIRGTATDKVGNTAVQGIVKSVKLSIPSAGIENVEVSGISSWQYEFDSEAAGIGLTEEESVPIILEAEDFAGNVGRSEAVLYVNQLADIPKVRVTNFQNGEKKYGIFTVTGTAEDDDVVKEVEVSIDNPSAGWVKASGANSWSYKLDCSLLTNGEHVFYYRSVDIYGKKSDHTPGGRENRIDFVVDPDIPIIEFDFSDNEAINGDRNVTGKAEKFSGVVKSVEMKLQGTTHSENWFELTGSQLSGLNTGAVQFSYPINAALYGEGPISIFVRAKDDMDKLGDRSSSIFIDTKKLAGGLNLPASNYLERNNVLEISGSIIDDEPSSGIANNDVQIIATYRSDRSGTNTSIVDGTGTKITDGLSNFTYRWTIPSAQKDGLYDICLEALDRAKNGFSDELKTKRTNIRLARYTPKLSDLTINDVAVTNNMYVAQTCSFKGKILDNDPNDQVAGVAKIEVYLSDTQEINAVSKKLFEKSYSAYPTEVDFSHSVTLTERRDYIVYRVTDRVGGWSDYPYMVYIDFAPPKTVFRYSSVGHDPKTAVASIGGYSDTFWIKLDASDTLDGVSPANIDGSTIEVGVGTSASDNGIAANKIYMVGDYLKLDLYGRTGRIYVNYKLKDKAGNITQGSLSFDRAADLPTMSLPLDDGWTNQTQLTVTGTNVVNGSIKYSSVDYSGEVNDLAGRLTTVGSDNQISLGDSLTAGDHSLYVIATASDSKNVYRKYEFTFDDTAPETTYAVREDEGALEGHVDGDLLSGKVTFYGTITDNMGNRLNNTDFTLSVLVDGAENVVPSANIIKNSSDEFEWTWSYDTQTHPNVVKKGVEFLFKITDKAGNERSYSKSYDFVPFIRRITEISGKVVAVKGWNLEKQVWENRNYDQSYTYRINNDGKSITLNGFNLNASGSETITYTGGNKSWTKNAGSNQTVSVNLSDQGETLTSGELYITVGGISSNRKKITMIKNYGASVYSGVAECDMVVKDNNNALLIYQKHTDGGTVLLRDWETAEGVFSQRRIDTTRFISRGYNRYWFLNVVKDRSAVAAQSSPADNKYYILRGDTEYNANNNAQTGVQLAGKFDAWASLASYYHPYGSDTNVQIPRNDWSPPGSGNIQYKNRWRMSAANGASSNAGEPKNTPAGAADWSAEWGDLVADKNNVHTVWFSLYDNTMYYRMLVNQASDSLKYPADGAVSFGIAGKYPAITVDDAGNPVIICYDETNGNLVVYYGKSSQPSSVSVSDSFDRIVIASGDGVGLYPKIEISNGIHVFYQDGNRSSLNYIYAANKGALASAEKIELDRDSAPGYYNDIRVVDGKPMVTYLAYGYLGTGNAVRTARFVGSATIAEEYRKKTNWEVLTLPCERGITENKVRGYVAGSGASGWIFGFAKSDYPEFFREKK